MCAVSDDQNIPAHKTVAKLDSVRGRQRSALCAAEDEFCFLLVRIQDFLCV